MSGSLEQLRLISSEMITSARKRRSLARILKKGGFLPLGKGAWLGFRGEDTVSGLLIEGSPSDTYISSFILPVFDELRFVSWSLGRRVVHCSPDSSAESECERAIAAYRTELLPIRSATDIIDYLDTQRTDGFYPLWVSYICYLRNGFLETARMHLTNDKVSELHPSVLKRMSEIFPSVASGDTLGVARVLEKWGVVSRVRFGYGEFSIGKSG